MTTEEPDPQHVAPTGADDLTLEAVAKLTEALETTERARGHLYDFHQLTGKADFEVSDAAELLHQAGHHDLADRLGEELVGRNVLYGRWTFQVVEDYDDNYWQPFRDLEREVRGKLLDGKRHLHEAELKERRRTRGHDAHVATPE